MRLLQKMKWAKNVLHKAFLISLLILITLTSTLTFLNREEYNPSLENNFTKNLKGSRTVRKSEQWIEDPFFNQTVDTPWFSTNGTEGDNSDINTAIEDNVAKFKVLGENRTIMAVSGTVNNSVNSMGWVKSQNGDFLLPDSSDITDQGCYVSHSWFDDENQFPSVHFMKNVTVPIDMSDYEIISASLDIVFNATVSSNVDTPNDGLTQFAIGDSVTTYCEISNILHNPPIYRVAENKSEHLGQNSPSLLFYGNSRLITVSDPDLIGALNSAFESDPEHSNFLLTLGVDIYSEDNTGGNDLDDFDSIFIKSCNLTFTCVRKIDHSTKVSWNQVTKKLYNNTQLVSAKLNFKYKMNQTWPSLAPLSELRILINNRIINEHIVKMVNINTTYESFSNEGVDITNLISEDDNISLSIELFIKDSFNYPIQNILFIDDVILNITYDDFLPDYATTLDLFINGEDITNNPIYEVALNKPLNISLIYKNATGNTINNATVLLIGSKIFDNMTQISPFSVYSKIINTSRDLTLGSNSLNIEVSFPDHQTITINPTILLRRNNINIISLSNSNIIISKPGRSLSVSVFLNNTDFNENITQAIISYESDIGSGLLTDDNDDGIYDLRIQDIPEGTFLITIKGSAGDQYLFNSLEITLIATSDPPLNLLPLIIILSSVAVGIIAGFSIYQLYYKYPPIIRKIRKILRKIEKNKSKISKADIKNRKDRIDDMIHSNRLNISPSSKNVEMIKESIINKKMNGGEKHE
ncbi:MAG: hypothetical protein GF311_15535 [Candidatus Lokiarchaeota archaeon]|nr:hypothetical protein [Candidatus Lokiarchaeota archaeon]